MFSINYRDPRPVYEQIMDEMRRLIISGVFPPDEKLPSVRELAQQLAINPNTIQRAYRELEQSGYIYSVAGKGNFAGAKHEVDVHRRESLLGRLREIDWRILRTQVEENGFITPGEAAQKLGVGVAAAWNRLQFLEKWGYLVHVGRKYYAADKTPPAERMRELLYKYISENGSIGCQEAAELLNIPYRQIGYLLRTMVKKGELSTVKRGRYELPSNALPEREGGPRSGG